MSLQKDLLSFYVSFSSSTPLNFGSKDCGFCTDNVLLHEIMSLGTAGIELPMPAHEPVLAPLSSTGDILIGQTILSHSSKLRSTLGFA